MKLKNISKEELELMSYTDITYQLLKESKKKMNTPSLFKEICKLLTLSEEDYTAKIGDYYTSLTLDKRFVLIDNAQWDIRDNHKIDIVLDDEDEEEISEEVEEEIVEEETEEAVDSIDNDDIDDELEDLAIIDDEEEENLDLDDENEND
jgi:DNA-directed RNA polymerase subunit delta